MSLKMLKYILPLVLFFSTPVYAEIYQMAIPNDSETKLFWWPVLPEIKGWYHDRKYSLNYGLNAQAPNDFTFANAETVIYARAIYKPRVPNLKTLGELIQNDKEDFLRNDPSIVIKETDSFQTSDGKLFKSLLFTPSNEGNWEQVSYGEENDFYLIFTISSRTEDGFKKSVLDYQQFILKYEE